MRASYLIERSIILFLLAMAHSVKADILVGRSQEAPLPDVRLVSVFGDTMNGNTEPLSLLGGSNTGMQFVTSLTHDPVSKEMYMADFTGQNVCVFDQNDRLNVAPKRCFNNLLLGQPRDVVIDHAHGEIIANNFAFVLAFPINATGTVTALRSTTYLPSLIQNMGGMDFLSGTDEVAVADYEPITGGNQGRIRFFPRTISGTPVESRFLAGGNTQLGDYVLDVLALPDRQELVALVGIDDMGITRGRIVVFNWSASGNANPVRVIAGANTLLESVSKIAYNPTTNELLVTANVSSGDTPRILGFPVNGTGNIAPLRNIGGSNTTMTPGQGWYGIAAYDANALFKNGFE